MPNQEKIKAVAELKGLFEGANSFFVTDYQGLTVADLTQLRKAFRSNDVTYLVAKNTLFRIAMGEVGVKGVDDHFAGPTAVAFAHGDPAVAAKVIQESVKVRELPRVKAFVVDRKVYDAADLKRLADLPSREVLLSQLVAAVESPLSALVRSLDGFFVQLVGSIDALAEKRKSEGM